jgi:hypothetical protein
MKKRRKTEQKPVWASSKCSMYSSNCLEECGVPRS